MHTAIVRYTQEGAVIQDRVSVIGRIVVFVEIPDGKTLNFSAVIKKALIDSEKVVIIPRFTPSERSVQSGEDSRPAVRIEFGAVGIFDQFRTK